MAPKALQTVPAWPHTCGVHCNDNGVSASMGCSSSSAESWLQQHKLPSRGASVTQEGSRQTTGRHSERGQTCPTYPIGWGWQLLGKDPGTAQLQPSGGLFSLPSFEVQMGSSLKGLRDG